MTDAEKIIATLASKPELADRHADILVRLLQQRPETKASGRGRGMGLSRNRPVSQDLDTGAGGSIAFQSHDIKRIISFLLDFDIIYSIEMKDELSLETYRSFVSNKIKSVFKFEVDTPLLRNALRDISDQLIKVARPTAPQPMPSGKPPAKPDTTQTIFSVAADPKEIGAKLKAARLEAGVTQAVVAEAMGTKENAIRRLERGEHSPSIDTIRKYAEAIGYDVGLSFSPFDS
ncbi:putative transcriptional regulator [Hoeflea phototrophica DFL-43]|uniref:Putative transcriptional regulator n=1 Tax=Hoeflea phototrophica (strain DSM 17068 / NCIMB 14078 / DFL-43) TaxID=411684 RepID=A9CY43_HOEPD|nr:helix-turn-helix transcriptional regulator [Hoeflea phototrophica]EDQ34537.1 putative transcriptional regulator [Hoeflea phototrophica DFL-43]